MRNFNSRRRLRTRVLETAELPVFGTYFCGVRAEVNFEKQLAVAMRFLRRQLKKKSVVFAKSDQTHGFHYPRNAAESKPQRVSHRERSTKKGRSL